MHHFLYEIQLYTPVWLVSVDGRAAWLCAPQIIIVIQVTLVSQ